MNQIPFPESVRLALPAEAGAIAAVQRAWLGCRPGLAVVLDQLDPTQMSEAWTQAITRPPLATYRVLVAVDSSGDVVGFAAVGPSDDEDAEHTDGLVGQFCVHPERGDAGHEDRLMHAVADTLRADGFTRATCWVLSSDDATRALLVDSGWEPDGAHQEIGNELLRVKQIRLHTALV